jgi:hypothetical protein
MFIIDNSLDQKKLNEYNFSGNSDLSIFSPTLPGKGKIKSIDEEIHFLTELSMLVQEKNEKYKNLIEEKMKNKTGYQTIDEEFQYDFDNKKNDKIKYNFNNIQIHNSKKLDKILLILKNSAFHIYKLQLIQFAENIKRIYKNSKTKEYFITFDNTDEEIPSIILGEKDYNNLIAIRDKYSNNDILSSFISKEDCVNPNSINNQKKNKCLTPNKIKNNNNNILKINQKKSKDDSYFDNISNNNIFSHSSKGNFYYLSSYNICHQCKLQKIDEDLIKCQYIHTFPNTQNQNSNNIKSSHSNNKNKNKNNNTQSNLQNENPINYFFIGQSAIILTNKIYYLKNYDDSVKELVDNYFVHKLKETTKKCEKYYCKNCLRSIYDIDINEIRKKNFRCPYCSNRCNCSRCIRYENLIKQIAYYLNNYGDIDKLYDYLVQQNSIFEKLKDYLILSKFICIDFNTKNYTPLKLNIPNSKNQNNSNDGDYKNNELNSLELLKYKKNLEKMQMDFCNIYDETNLKKQLYDTEILKIKETNNKESEKEDQKLIGQKIKSPNNRKK